MKNRILNLAVVLFALTFLVSGCQQELLRDAETQHTATQSHKFQVVKLQDIPNVVQFIKKQTGRSDLKIPMGGKKINALAKGAIEFSELETDFILKVTKEDAVYYVFGISNAGDESTLYNFEVKEVEREVVRAELIEFASDEPFDEEYSNISNFNGKVSSYNDKKELVNISYFQEGINGDCPPTAPPGSGGGGGGGDVPIEPINPNDPYNPLPSWPIGGGGGGGSDTPSENPPAGGDCGWILSYDYVVNGVTFYVFINCKNETKKVFYINITIKSSLSPNCDDGSGVVVLPGTKPKTPCQSTKKTLENEKVQDGINDLETFLANEPADSKNETGFKEDINGDVTPTIGGEFTNNSGPVTGNLGAYHVHPNSQGNIHMFSATDIMRLLEFSLAQTPTSNYGLGYIGMIAKETCDCPPLNYHYVHYVIRFSGSYSQLQNLPFGFMQMNINKWKNNQTIYDATIKSQNQNNPPNGFLNQEGREKLFFKTLKDMGLQNLITLQRVEDNNKVYNITQNSNGELNQPIECK